MPLYCLLHYRGMFAELAEALCEFLSSVVMMGKVVLSRMVSRWHAHGLQWEAVRSLNQCVNGGGRW